ncbi:hypothetical protein [Aquitalea sp. ASV15]|nr:hypothetical protein [Aquitalea sp. ASV15]
MKKTILLAMLLSALSSVSFAACFVVGPQPPCGDFVVGPSDPCC